jgi:hypothetical protein
LDSWGLEEQTRKTIECFPTLTEAEQNEVLSEWGQNTYEDNWHGYQQAQADLIHMCRWKSMSSEQRSAENQRNTRLKDRDTWQFK